MAEGSRDQAAGGGTDPEEDSPNMIVYRKVRVFAVEKRLVDTVPTAHWSVSGGEFMPRVV